MFISTYLKKAGVPEGLHQSAILSLWGAAFRFALVAPVKIVGAAFMGRVAGLTSARVAEQPRRLLAWFGNNISMNGDRGPWSWKKRADGVAYSSRDPVPQDELYRKDDDGSLTLYNYYYRPGEVFATDRRARAAFLTRNPASRLAQKLGKAIKPVDIEKPGSTEWADTLSQWRYSGEDGQIWVIEIQGVWCIRFRRRTALGFWIQGGFGYKLNNLGSDYHCLDPNMRASVSHIGFPCKRPDPEATIFGERYDR